MAGTVSNTNIIPVWVCFKGVNLGFCNPGDVVLTVTPNWQETLFYQSGNYLMDASFNGAKVTVKCEFAEVEEPDLWLAAFGFGDKQTDSGGSNPERFAFNTIDTVASQWDIGIKATAIAGILALLPETTYADATTYGNDDIYIPKAFCREVGDILFSTENNQGLSCTFEGLLQPTDSSGVNLLIRGKLTGTGTWS